MKVVRSFSLIIFSLWLVGCASQVPVAMTYPLTTQKKMQAAHHWDVLAADVAQRLQTSLSSLDNGGQPVVLHIEKPQYSSVFGYAFHQLLATQLMAHGFGVSENPAEGLPLRCNLQLITHKNRGFIRPAPGIFTGLAAGVGVIRNLAESSTPEAGILLGTLAADVGAGYITGGTPDNEVIVTTSVMSGDRYITRMSDIYYISDNNFRQYIAKVPGPTRFIEVVGDE